MCLYDGANMILEAGPKSRPDGPTEGTACLCFMVDGLLRFKV
jgi:hypothetical protein